MGQGLVVVDLGSLLQPLDLRRMVDAEGVPGRTWAEMPRGVRQVFERFFYGDGYELMVVGGLEFLAGGQSAKDAVRVLTEWFGHAQLTRGVQATLFEDSMRPHDAANAFDATFFITHSTIAAELATPDIRVYCVGSSAVAMRTTSTNIVRQPSWEMLAERMGAKTEGRLDDDAVDRLYAAHSP